jgi:Ca2+-binding EF-hand superfamily protein
MITKLKQELASRGAHGFIGLQRKFRIMDDDGSGSLSLAEFKKAMAEMRVKLSEAELRLLFDFFDVDKSGCIGFEEFMQGVRDPMSVRRLALVNQAFAVLDLGGRGEVEAEDIAKSYNASKHPDVVSGRKTQEAVLREFLETFDVGGEVDGKVTRHEFQNYYANISASIDNDDYFELMIRNAWHISGGTGAAANSANRRVLVTRADGSQSVEEIKNDLGLEADDKAGMMARLRAQGVDASNIDLYGGGEDNKKPGAKPVDSGSSLLSLYLSLSQFLSSSARSLLSSLSFTPRNFSLQLPLGRRSMRALLLS